MTDKEFKQARQDIVENLLKTTIMLNRTEAENDLRTCYSELTEAAGQTARLADALHAACRDTEPTIHQQFIQDVSEIHPQDKAPDYDSHEYSQRELDDYTLTIGWFRKLYDHIMPEKLDPDMSIPEKAAIIHRFRHYVCNIPDTRSRWMLTHNLKSPEAAKSEDTGWCRKEIELRNKEALDKAFAFLREPARVEYIRTGRSDIKRVPPDAARWLGNAGIHTMADIPCKIKIDPTTIYGPSDIIYDIQRQVNNLGWFDARRMLDEGLFEQVLRQDKRFMKTLPWKLAVIRELTGNNIYTTDLAADVFLPIVNRFIDTVNSVPNFMDHIQFIYSHMTNGSAIHFTRVCNQLLTPRPGHAYDALDIDAIRSGALSIKDRDSINEALKRVMAFLKEPSRVSYIEHGVTDLDNLSKDAQNTLRRNNIFVRADLERIILLDAPEFDENTKVEMLKQLLTGLSDNVAKELLQKKTFKTRDIRLDDEPETPAEPEVSETPEKPSTNSPDETPEQPCFAVTLINGKIIDTKPFMNRKNALNYANRKLLERMTAGGTSPAEKAEDRHIRWEFATEENGSAFCDYWNHFRVTIHTSEEIEKGAIES